MANFELKLPAMGESVAEATITLWLKEVGDVIDIDDTIVEVATDKVDSEVPSEVRGKLIKILAKKDETVSVGQTIAIIEVEGEKTIDKNDNTIFTTKIEEKIEKSKEIISNTFDISQEEKFYSPLVKNIAKTEKISITELNSICGTGKEGRVTKDDILKYIKTKKNVNTNISLSEKPNNIDNQNAYEKTTITINSSDEIVEMTRMGKLISKHMINSLKISAHVQSFIEIDVTNIVKWRNKIKNDYQKREKEKLTFTPIFMQAVAQTIKKHPMVNISIDGDKIIKKGNINLGMAAALPDGNLIVPVIKNADRLSLLGMVKQVNDLAKRSKSNNLKPDEIQEGTYTVTNVGSFGSITGTPIINQPQVAILALGAIVKKPSVIETPEGDFIGIRHKMIVSHSYDHRVVNGAEGGLFIKTLKDILENWDINKNF